ncbi:MAG: cation transporter [Gammaproteobacteria bacterium]|nr:cation transporter [Gammaproteobacteria bacterium]
MSVDPDRRDHDHDHDHDHGHGHGHSHAPPKDFGSAFAIGTGLNLGIVVLQVVYGLIAHSTALLADAGHNLSDVLGLVVAWGAASLAKRPATQHFTYGWRGSSILAALLNASLLLVVMGGIAWEAILRLSHPVAVHGQAVIAVAAVGIVVNGVTAWLFASGRHGDINVRGAFLHMLSDALVSLGVVFAGIAIAFTGRRWIDPVATLAIVAVIVYGTWGLLRDSVRMALAGVPVGIDPEAVRAYLTGLPEVSRIHDLHIWPMSTTETALTCHLVTPAGHPGDRFTLAIAQELRRRFAIEHTTVQVEVAEDADCRLADAHG